MRTPEQIIGRDHLLQLIFEGYVVVPRDPTDGMRMAGHAALYMSAYCEPHIGSQVGIAALREVWQAMIDEALSSATGQSTMGSRE